MMTEWSSLTDDQGQMMFAMLGDYYSRGSSWYRSISVHWSRTFKGDKDPYIQVKGMPLRLSQCSRLALRRHIASRWTAPDLAAQRSQLGHRCHLKHAIE